ncbi:DUF4129 domain-containing protein [Brevundimonas sp.]|uniref:DUF4129 domain-containing protein n=1 Tax=Brevundimonas sp. TaxID=1871086 RepID=UPI002FCC74E0
MALRFEITPAGGGATAIASPSDPATQAGLAEAHARLLKDRGLQFDRSGFTPPETPDWLHWIGDALRLIAPLMKYVFWAGLVAIAGLILFAIGREVLKLRGPLSRPRQVESAKEPEWRPALDAARDLLASADVLAARGLYAEAAHLLLLRSVEDIQQRQPRTVRISLTAREIASLSVIPDSARPAFALIAGLVERSLFGGAAVAAGEFADCRRAYEAFAIPEGWTR